MNKPLIGEKIAVLVSNGFNEQDFIQMQRLVQDLGGTIRIISMNNGLTSSWSGSDWGLNFAADKMLNEALAADFSMLVVPGGQRSVEKLKLTAHTRRFINGFLDSGKPVVVLAEALELLEYAEKLAGRTVAGMDEKKDMAEQAGAQWATGSYAIDANLLSAGALSEDSTDILAAIKEFLVADTAMVEAA
ncbi:MAG: DJ-1/PfpI family protein [Alphaproteobacteria bacterium]|nr:DJ-1/PfpI family protein [Alphaproteobacteria bacterium]